MSSRPRLIPSVILLAVLYLGVQYLWIIQKQLGLTLALLTVACAAGAWILRGADEAPLPVALPVAGEAEAAQGLGAGLLALLIGGSLVWLGFKSTALAQQGEWGLLSLSLVGAGLLLRVSPERPLPAFSARTGALVMLGLFGLAAAFRLHKVGDVPVGFCGVDEAGIFRQARMFVNGLRTTYYTQDLNMGADGTVPYYLLMLGLKAFGDSMKGWRLENALVGVLLTGLVWKAGKELGGRWVGAVAAFLWAVSLWPVTVTRANYFMGETTLVVMLCVAFLFAAFRRGAAWRWVLAGFFWGLCFNIYPAARVMLALVPWLFVLAWMFAPKRRPAALEGAWGVLLGFAIGMAPLLLWMRSETWAMKAYFVAFNNVGHQGGNLGGGGLLSRIDLAFSRVLTAFPRNFSLLTTQGPVNPHFFPYQYPVLHPALLGLGLLGVGVALSRFREPLHAFLLYWWALGLLPAMASAEGTVPHDRRAIMVLMPTLFLAALGAVAVLRQASTVLTSRLGRAALLIGVLAAGAWYTGASWQDYFERNQKDAALLNNGRANFSDLMRAVAVEHHKGPAVLISTWRLNADDWAGPLADPYMGWLWEGTNQGLPVLWAQEYPDYFLRGGLSHAVGWAQGQIASAEAAKETAPDVLVLLAPFHYYLEPAILGLGGKLVKTVGLVESSGGPFFTVGMAFHPSEMGRLYRIPAKDFGVAAKLPGPFTLELAELQPAGRTREQVRALSQQDPQYRELVKGYQAQPGRWSAGRTAQLHVNDPWFWTTYGNLPGGLLAPLRMRLRLRLAVEAEGDYAFGASSDMLTRLKVDGRLVFDRDALDIAQQEKVPAELLGKPGIPTDVRERQGYLGRPLKLKAGQHDLEIEAVMFSPNPSFAQLLRPIWKAPGMKEAATLPLEILQDRK